MRVASPQRQDLHDIEQAFHAQTRAERRRREAAQRQIAQRTRQRELDRVHRHGSLRFVALILVLIATAVLVTVAMFETLFLVMS